VSSLLSLLLIHRQAGAQSGPGIYFQETCHWVGGEFLEAYRRSLNPHLIYGLPITDAFVDTNTRLLTQYFDKARFVLYESEQYPLRVRLSPLGQFVYEETGPGIPLSRPPGLAACRKFTETGKEVCYAFLEFFDSNGGLA
jgi:hypothetical protein